MLAKLSLAQPLCIVEDCDRPVMARGWCSKHYMSWYAHKDPAATAAVVKPCVVCGAEFKGRKTTRVCSWQCRSRLSGARSMDEIRANAKRNETLTCKYCKGFFKRSRSDKVSFCSRRCSSEHKRWVGSASRKPRLPHSRVFFPTCGHCLKVFTSRRGGKTYCSDNCGKQASAIRMVELASQLRGKRECICKECGSPFTTEYGDKRSAFCSKKCNRKTSRRARKPLERARRRAVNTETVDPFKVFDRDGWRCQICHRPTPRRLRGTIKGNAPELDHIVPLARGGEHSYSNTQCACRSCNGAKGARVYGQLMMFAV